MARRLQLAPILCLLLPFGGCAESRSRPGGLTAAEEALLKGHRPRSSPVSVDSSRKTSEDKERAEKPVKRTLRRLRDPIEYLPEKLPLVAGVRFDRLSQSEEARGLLFQFQILRETILKFGITDDDVLEIWSGSNPVREETLVILRYRRPYDVAKLKERLGLPTSAGPGDKQVYDVNTRSDAPSKNQARSLSMADPVTILAGTKGIVTESLENPHRRAEWAAAMAPVMERSPPCWCIADSLSAGGWINSAAMPFIDWEKLTTGGYRRVVLSLDFQGGFAQHVSFVFDDEPRASQHAEELRKAITAAGGNTHLVKEKFLDDLAKIIPLPDFSSSAPKLLHHAINVSGNTATLTLVYNVPQLPFSRMLAESLGKRVSGDALVGGSIEVLKAPLGAWSGIRVAPSERPASTSAPIETKRRSETPATASGLDGGSQEPKGIYFIDDKDQVLNSLSFFCGLLPYMGRDDVHSRINYKKSLFAETENLQAAFTIIPEFLNPNYSEIRRKGPPVPGIALSHFVGMSGVEDSRSMVAARLPRTDPRAGVFGYDKVATPAQITDGLGNTIMLISSDNICGGWIQGGGATVRGARAPYFDENTGFIAKGTPEKGAFVLMADGSARFIPATIEPKVFRSLCTIHGGESIDVSATTSPSQGKSP